MFPTKVLSDALRDLLATDTGTLAPVALAVHVHLITSAFTPSLVTDFTVETEATFTGGAAKAAGVGAQQAFFDPVSGRNIVQLLEPVGGWTWLCTVDPAAPETIVGYIVTDNADAVTYGSALLEGGPVTIQAAGEGIVIPNVRLSMPLVFAQ